MYQHVFPFLRTLGGDGSTYAHPMKDARFTIPTPALLARVVDLLDNIPMEDRDTKGDLYEYMLGKIATAGTTYLVGQISLELGRVPFNRVPLIADGQRESRAING